MSFFLHGDEDSLSVSPPFLGVYVSSRIPAVDVSVRLSSLARAFPSRLLKLEIVPIHRKRSWRVAAMEAGR